MEDEGGHRLELVDKGITQIQEEFVESLSQSEWEMIVMLAELEIWFENLELQVSRIAMEKVSGVAPQESSS